MKATGSADLAVVDGAAVVDDATVVDGAAVVDTTVVDGAAAIDDTGAADDSGDAAVVATDAGAELPHATPTSEATATTAAMVLCFGAEATL